MTLDTRNLAAGRDYPVELVPPDLAAYREGNTGIEYVWTFEAKAPGPHVALTAVVHGNEPCGAIALDWLFKRAIQPARGKLSLAFINVEAYAAFDPVRPSASRWVDEDANRLWDQPVFDAPASNAERRRVQAIRPWLEGVDLLLDLHSMQHATEPLTLAGLLPRSLLLAERIGVPATIMCDAGHAAGRRMRDFAQFGDPDGEATALLVECGQHWAADSAAVAIETTVRFLRVAGSVAPDFAADLVAPGPPPGPVRVIDVTDAITVRSDSFRFSQPFVGMESIEKAGTVIAEDRGEPVTTPYDDCILIMPSRRLWPGQTAVRLGRERKA